MAAGNPCRTEGCAGLAEADRAECSACRYARRSSPVSRIEPAARILVIDIETSPLIGYAWKEWDTSIIKVIEPTRMLCFAAKWVGDKGTMFFSEHTHGRQVMIQAAHDLLDEADAVVHYNGQRFDVPHINRELWLAGIKPPSPFAQIDLLLAVRKRFKFSSNKLQNISKALGLEGKAHHEGFGLWEKCLNGEDVSWKLMERYNRQDVKLTETVYERLLPWLPSNLNGQLYGGTGCPTCGSAKVQRRGFAYTKVSKFRQYACSDCGSFFRSTKREGGVDLQAVAR